MNAITENILREAADAFAFDRTTGEISRYGEGHINDTFVVWASDKCKRYIMQRINTDTFKNPKELMENVCHVTGFLRKVSNSRYIAVVEERDIRWMMEERFDILDKVRAAGLRVGVYPVSEHCWMDMGQMEELDAMRRRMENA